MNPIKKKAVALKNHIVTHRAKITFVITATAGLALVVRNQLIMNEFLEEHGLLEEYYATEED